MSGTLTGIANIQQWDLNGERMSGAQLRLYDADTVAPVIAFKDPNLTPGQEHPWPIVADATGRVPYFFLPDGNYRARLSSSNGAYVAFDEPSLPTVGQAASGGGGGSVAPELLFRTGYVMWLPVNEQLDGFVRHNGRTIGSAASGASERASADTQALYEYLWNKYDDARCPVATGRGVSSAADFAAGKPIATLDLRFMSPVGLDTMGNAAAARATGVPITLGSATVAASILGEALHVLTQLEMPRHQHGGTTGSETAGHDHPYVDSALEFVGSGSNVEQGSGDGYLLSDENKTTGQNNQNHAHNFATDFRGFDEPHNNTPLVMTGTFFVKL